MANATITETIIEREAAATTQKQRALFTSNTSAELSSKKNNSRIGATNTLWYYAKAFPDPPPKEPTLDY